MNRKISHICTVAALFLALLLSVSAACSNGDDGSVEPAGSVETEESTTTTEPVSAEDEGDSTTAEGTGASDGMGGTDGMNGMDDSDSQVHAGEESAVIEAFSLIFDPDADFSAKIPHIEDAESLQSVVAEVGDLDMSVEVLGAIVEGDAAEVNFIATVGERKLFDDGVTLMNKVDGTWMIERLPYCGLLAAAGITCP